MKKYFLILVVAISFLGVSTVKADSKTYNNVLSYTQYLPNKSYSEIADHFTTYGDIYSKLYDDLYEYYSSNYSELYPYYIIKYFPETWGENYPFSYRYLRIRMYLFQSIPTLDFNTSDNVLLNSPLLLGYSYDFSTSSYISPFYESNNNSFLFATGSYFYLRDFYYSNFDLVVNLSSLDSVIFSFSNSYSNNSLENLVLYDGDKLPSYQEHLNLDIISDPNLPSSSYTEINLNNYPYVALSLKDYSLTEEYYTNMEVLGQYCFTPVYNYGLTERKDILTGSKVQGCSPYYENYTPVRTYVLKSDIENHAIYYLKAYDSTRDNKVKVDTSVFDIHYITFEDEDNPILTIGGRNYPAIPYDNLTDSSTISEAEGYVSGASCMVGDFNCMFQYTGYNFSDIFDSPLNFLKNLWTSITEVFKLVVMFISLLPTPIQYFFYISFMLAIIIGLIKIIL